MSIEIYLLVTLSLIVVAVAYPRWRLQRLRRAEFPDTWLVYLQSNLPVYAVLPTDLQKQLQQLIKLFLYRKIFYGCGGLTINDEIRVSIAAQACLLLLNHPTSVYRRLRYILVYPDAFEAERLAADAAGVVTRRGFGLLGESWSNGKIILSWDDVKKGAGDFHDGSNVVLHEFAHQLDQESGAVNGAPLLQRVSAYRSWARVLSKEYQVLGRKTRRGEHSLIDRYGATNPAEFFAVATETFFEKPQLMSQEHPELFAELLDYYCVDPRQWGQ